MDSKPLRRNGVLNVWRHLTGCFAGIMLVQAIAFAAAPVPADKPANYPAWWFERGVILRLDINVAAPLWGHHDYPEPDDYAAANLGQLKQIASKAAAEMDSALLDGAGQDVNSLVAQWSAPPAAGIQRDDFAALNLGQLKTVSKVFYDRLIAAHYTTVYPWANGTADDYATANLGQVKCLFSFDLKQDTDGDRIPDWWEVHYGLNPTDPSDAAQLSQDGALTNLQKYQLGLDPLIADTDGDGVSDSVEILQGRNPRKGAIADSSGQVRLEVFTPLD